MLFKKRVSIRERERIQRFLELKLGTSKEEEIAASANISMFESQSSTISSTVLFPSSEIVIIFLLYIEAVQQFKIGRKRKVDNALNQKRRNIFGAKTNCETASITYNFYIFNLGRGFTRIYTDLISSALICVNNLFFPVFTCYGRKLSAYSTSVTNISTSFFSATTYSPSLSFSHSRIICANIKRKMENNREKIAREKEMS